MCDTMSLQELEEQVEERAPPVGPSIAIDHLLPLGFPLSGPHCLLSSLPMG